MIRQMKMNEEVKTALRMVCVSPDSLLRIHNPSPEPTEVVTIDKALGFLSKEGFKLAFDTLARAPNVTIFVSIPCAGGCDFNQGVNWYKGPSTREKIIQHWADFERLWNQLERLLREHAKPVTAIRQ